MAKRYSPKFKFHVVLEVLTGDKTNAQVAKAYGVHPNSANTWRRTLLEKGPEIFAQDGTVAQYERRIAKLEHLIGQKEIEIALLKNFLGRTP
ncbi:MAG: transposase [Chloroflexi bacterium]|nr:transposase [Chloroflexota bacterium]